MNRQVTDFMKEGLINRLIRYFRSIAVKKWFMALLGHMVSFFWRKKGCVQLDEPDYGHMEDEGLSDIRHPRQ